MKMGAKFEVKNETFDASFEQTDSTFDADFSNVGGGQDGKDGATFIPSVSKEGVISWTNNGNLPNPTPVNIKGEKGEKGERGLQGVQGERGEKGEQGIQGIQGEKGEKGADGTNGKDGINGKDGYTPIKGVDYFDGKDGKDGVDGKDGYTPVKGVDYFDGVDGKDGKDGTNGIDGADGFSPIVAVTNIDGGHRVSITDKDGTKPFDVMNGKDGKDGADGKDGNDYILTEEDKSEIVDDVLAELPELPSGSSKAIIDVVELPTENINEDVFYRLLMGSLVVDQFVQTMYNVYCVETLPETGKPATNIDQTEGNIYYNLADGNAYGYVDDMLSMGLGVPIGWYPVDILLSALGYGYSGVITDILDDPKDGTFRVLLKYVTYSYKDGEWTSYEVIGWRGTGVSAEIFNHPSNEASGIVSHAEGENTVARGDYSHAEGSYTIASGNGSHAEGNETNAEGNFSHVEGEGTHAKGDCSHAEGLGTVANARQHVQGTYNFEDAENKYVHIVGNGYNSDNRSNAHTIDWQGNAWFQGEVKVGGTGQDDPNAKKLATEAYVDNKVAELNGGKITNLTNTSFTWNDTPNLSTKGIFNVDFTVDGVNYSKIAISQTYIGGQGLVNIITYDGITVYNEKSGWVDNKYKDVKFTGGTDATDVDFIAILNSNGDLQKAQIDPSNLATVDKIEVLTLNEGAFINTNSDEYGLSWEQTFGIYDEDDNCLKNGTIIQVVPIVAGSGIEFEKDEENQVVKINATGGGSPDNVVMNYKVEVGPSTTVAVMISTIQGMGADISKFNVVTLYGYQSATLGMKINHYGGNVYNINAIDLMSGNTLSNTADWSGVGVGNFIVMFKGAIPYYDSSNEGQVLKIVNGVPTWATL